MKRIKEEITDLYFGWKEERLSVKIGNLIVILGYFLSLIHSIELFTLITLFLSIMSIAISIDGLTKCHYWIGFLPTTWFIVFLIFSSIGLAYLFGNIINFIDELPERFKKYKNGIGNREEVSSK